MKKYLLFIVTFIMGTTSLIASDEIRFLTNYEGISDMTAPNDVAISPDGKHVYVSSYQNHSISIFERNLTSGELTYVGKVQNGSGGVSRMLAAFGVDVSPDGKNVYVASPSSNAIVSFSRNAITGQLSLVDEDDSGFTLRGFVSVSVSPDGKTVYGIAGSIDGVVAFSRNASTGELTFLAQYTDVNYTYLGQHYSATASPINNIAFTESGSFIFVTSTADHAVMSFSRNTSTGALTVASTVVDGIGGVDGLQGASSIYLTPDNKHLYVSGQEENSIAIFSVNSSTGALTYINKVTNGIGGVTGLTTPRSLGGSPDGRYIYVSGYTDHALTAFERNSSTGLLTLVEQAIDDVSGADGFNGPNGIITDQNNRHLYVCGSTEPGLAVFLLTSPAIELSTTTATATELGAAVTLDTSLVVFDSDDTHIESGSISITSGKIATDTLMVTAPGSVTATYNDGVITLSGSATLETYRDILRSVQFQAGLDATIGNGETSERVISFTISDGENESNSVTITVTVNGIDMVPATVSTQSISDITQTTATGNGNITDLGTENPTQHGICWNTAGTPTIADNKTEEGAKTTTGAFTSAITGLTVNTTYYVRAYATNSGGTSYGNEVSFTTLNCVNPTNGGSISGDQADCTSFDPAEITNIALPTGHTGTLEYKWQQSTTSSTTGFSDISASNSPTYDPPSISSTTWYKRLSRVDCMSDWTGAAESNVVEITIYPEFVVGSISEDQSICYNTTPSELVGISPTGGNTPYSYQWQHSTDNSTFTNISGATSLNYQPSALSQTTYYRLVQTSSSGCGEETTNTVTITVYPEFSGGSISEDQSICYNTSPSELTGITPTGGNTPYSYQWQVSTDNSTFTNISGATSLNYQPSALSQTTYYRLVQTSSSGCGEKTTNTITITVYPEFSSGSISEDQSICYNTTPSELVGISPTGGNAPYSYQWQHSTDNSTFTNISGATSLNYQPSVLSQTTYYRLVQTSSSGCGEETTNTLTITVYPEFSGGSISEDQSICYNTSPSELTGIAPTGGNTPYSYQWQVSTDNSTFTNISGATSLNYQPSALSQTTYYRLVQTSSSGCGEENTNTVTITVYPEFAVGSISGDQFVCGSTIPEELTGVAPTGGNTPYSYQWQISTDGSTFTDISGATALNYQPGTLSEKTYYRLVQTSASGCGEKTTNTVTIDFYPELVAGTASSDQSICYNTTPGELTATSPSGGNGTYTYQWQYSTDNSTFTDITGATSLNYQPGALSVTTYYQLVQLSGDCGETVTNTVTITVYPKFVVGSISEGQSICYNTSPSELTGIAPTGGNAPYSYQWQISTDGTTFTDISGAMSLNYQPSALSQTTYYRLVQTSSSGCGEGTTNTLTITVYPEFSVGSISGDQFVCGSTIPEELIGVVPTGGNTPYSYQWQISTDGSTFTDISGATALNYQPGTLSEKTYYRLVQTSASGCGEETTNMVSIDFYPELVAGTASSDQSICYNTTPGELTATSPSGGNGTYTYQWQHSTDNSTFTDITGATSLNYQPGALSVTTYYQLVQLSGDCGETVTNTVTITVYPKFVLGSISEAQSICYNTSPSELTGIAPTGGNTPYSYQWQISTNNSTFTDISGATSLNYQPSALSQTTYYRLVQTSSSGCGEGTTNTLTITVYPEFAVGSISGDQTICYNTIPDKLIGIAPMGGSGAYTYQWQYSTDNSSFIDIAGATSLDYQPEELTETTYYQLIQTSTSGCGSFTTNSITVNVYPFVPRPQIIEKKEPGNVSILLVDNSENLYFEYLWSYADGSDLPDDLVNNRQFLTLPVNHMNASYIVTTYDKNACGLSSLAKVVTPSETFSLVYPTINQGKLRLDISGPEKGKINVRVYNASGLTLKTFQFEKGLKFESIPLNINDLKAGTYFIEVSIDKFKNTHRVFKGI